MKNSKVIFIIIILILVCFFYIPRIIAIYKIKKKLKRIEESIDQNKNKKIEFKEKIKDLTNITEELKIKKDAEIKKLDELRKINYLFMEGMDEEKSDLYLSERRNEEMEAYIRLYENNYISSFNTINILKEYFQSNKLINYLNNRTNILLVSSIIKDESDIDFIYNEIIYPFSLNKNELYILGPPCYKATIDSNEPYIFHKKCNKIKNSLVLIKTNKTRLGGITEYYWDINLNRKNTPYDNTRTMLFNLDNKNVFLYNKNQTVSRHIPPIRSENYYLLIFGYNDLYISYLPWECYSRFPQMFLQSNNTEKDFNELMNQKIEKYHNNKEIKFEYQEIEVYPILTQ